MSKKNIEERKRDNYHLKIIFSVLIMVLSFLAELYIMIIRKGDPIYLAIFGLIFLFFSYILMNSIMQIQYMQAKNEKEDHDALQKSEKASYLIIKKSFEEIFQRIDSLEKEIHLPTDELITAQKAIAKVNITRSKENTDALMNSNDQLLEKIMEFEDVLNNNNQKIIDSQNQIMDQQIKNIILKQQELSSAITEMQLSLKNEILQAVNTIKDFQPQQVIVQQPMSAANTPSVEETPIEDTLVMPEMSDPNKMMSPDDIATLLAGEEEAPEVPLMEEVAEPIMEEPRVEESAMEETPLMEEPAVEESVMEEAPLMEEAEPVMEEPILETPPMPDLSDPNKMMSPDDIAALLANAGVEEAAPEVPEVLEEAPLMEEPVIEEPVTEEAKEPMPETPPMPDLSDPNKMMSPDDIAALIANASSDGNASVPESEPIVEEEPEEEEEIPIPDLSDPNKMMSPDDIAALIANL